MFTIPLQVVICNALLDKQQYTSRRKRQSFYFISGGSYENSTKVEGGCLGMNLFVNITCEGTPKG
jgi:hypothetical protein